MRAFDPEMLEDCQANLAMIPDEVIVNSLVHAVSQIEQVFSMYGDAGVQQMGEQTPAEKLCELRAMFEEAQRRGLTAGTMGGLTSFTRN